MTPNKRLNDERLKRLEAIGFAWSAKSVRKTKPASPTESSVPKPKKTSADQAASRAAARQRANDALWNDMYNRLVEYKATYGVRLWVNPVSIAAFVDISPLAFSSCNRIVSSRKSTQKTQSWQAGSKRSAFCTTETTNQNSRTTQMPWTKPVLFRVHRHHRWRRQCQA